METFQRNVVKAQVNRMKSTMYANELGKKLVSCNLERLSHHQDDRSHRLVLKSTKVDCPRVSNIGQSNRQLLLNSSGISLRNCHHNHRWSSQQRVNVMRALIFGLIVATVLISLTALGKQILDYSNNYQDQQQQQQPNRSQAKHRVGLARVPFTKRDLESYNNQVANENSNGLLNASPSSSSWYDSLVSPISSIFGYEESPSDEELALSADNETQELRKVPRGYVNFLRPKSSKIVQLNGERTMESSAKNDKEHTYEQLASQISAKLENTHANENNQVDQLNAVNNSFRGDGYVTDIDKIKGIDIQLFKMFDKLNKKEKKVQQDNEELVVHREVQCTTNKFDRLIAQKIARNDLSRPVVTSNGRFNNPFPTWSQPSVVDALKFMILESDESNVPKNNDELEKELPLLKPNFQISEGKEQDYKVTWIGHSTLVIQIDGINILTDPIFSDRASPMQYFGPKRIREPACTIKSLPRIDVVVVSHNHYDHLDADSVKQLNERFGRNCRWIVPLGLGDFMKSMSVENYVELDWWQKDCFQVNNPILSSQKLTNKKNITTDNNNTSNSDTTNAKQISTIKETSNGLLSRASSNVRSNRAELDIYLTPNQHWSRRGVNDVNKSLWGSYTFVSGNGSTFFFGGDTGYCSAFKEIAKIFGPMTGAAIPIGAYKPRWFLKYSHVDPTEATQIHRDLKSAKSIAIHHSTFILSNEHYKEPSDLLKEVMSDLKQNSNVTQPFITLKHGESTEFCKAKDCNDKQL